MLYDPSKEYKAIPQFMTARQLGLSQRQYDALMMALAYMEDGKVAKISNHGVSKLEETRVWDTRKGSIDKIMFNMEAWIQPYVNCGTVCCIGGMAELLIKAEPMSLFDKAEVPDMLTKLFYPDSERGWKATPKQAAKVLRGYLTTGQTRW